MLGSMIFLTPAPRKAMTRTRQTKGSTSSKSSPCSPFFHAIGNKKAGNSQQNALHA